MSSTTAGSTASLTGRSAVITGASRGIGLECARTLHAAGARLVLVARSMDALARAGSELGSRTFAIACDMSEPDAVQGALQKIRLELSGAPDILINNAAQFFLAPIEQTSVNDFDRTLVVNLTSQFAFVREFLPDMRQRKRGHIVTIGSIADRHAFPENAAYSASKFGARGLHEVMRRELRGTGVRASLVSPGAVDTTIWDDVNPESRAGIPSRSQMLSAVAVADAVRFVVTRPEDVNIDELRLSHT